MNSTLLLLKEKYLGEDYRQLTYQSLSLADASGAEKVRV